MSAATAASDTKLTRPWQPRTDKSTATLLSLRSSGSKGAASRRPVESTPSQKKLVAHAAASVSGIFDTAQAGHEKACRTGDADKVKFQKNKSKGKRRPVNALTLVVKVVAHAAAGEVGSRWARLRPRWWPRQPGSWPRQPRRCPRWPRLWPQLTATAEVVVASVKVLVPGVEALAVAALVVAVGRGGRGGPPEEVAEVVGRGCPTS